MDLDTVEKVRWAFYRLCGTNADDGALTEQGETENDVAYLFLTRGTRSAQRWMLKMGYGGWRQRSAALSFSGTDADDGGRYVALPTDFLRTYGSPRFSALRQANGDGWGQEVPPEQGVVTGDFYYVRGEQLWLSRNAQPPSPLYLDYHFRHPVWSDTVTMDFPLEARALMVAEAANVAKEENWLLGGADMERKIERALARAREEARDIARPTKAPRTMRRPVRFGNHW